MCLNGIAIYLCATSRQIITRAGISTNSREIITRSREIITRYREIITRSRDYFIFGVALMCFRTLVVLY